ncbi:MAG TPA: flavodoxin family protein [Thermomonospora sp.]|nr:flavodoxin family protein [Thermomonospora sp.]
MVSVAIAYHSGNGHTAALAAGVAEGARDAGARCASLPVGTLTDDGWRTLADADAIVFGAPTYMGSPSAAFKAFMEDTSGIWQAQGWKDKLAAGFTCSGSHSGDKLNTLVDLALFAAQHGMQWVSLGLLPGWCTSDGGPHQPNRLGAYLGAMAQANIDQGPEVAPPSSDRETAFLLGRRVAELAALWRTAHRDVPIRTEAGSTG